MSRKTPMAHPDIISAWVPTTTTDESDKRETEPGFKVQIQYEFGAGP